jgi:hypothetical protein
MTIEGEQADGGIPQRRAEIPKGAEDQRREHGMLGIVAVRAVVLKELGKRVVAQSAWKMSDRPYHPGNSKNECPDREQLPIGKRHPP